MGVPDDLFWRLTLDEVLAVLKRHKERERAANLRAGLVAATVANVHRKKGSKSVKPEDFFADDTEPGEVSREEAVANIRAWTRRFKQSRN